MSRRVIIFLIFLLVCISMYAYVQWHAPNLNDISDQLTKAKWQKAKPDNRLLRSGDLIFRHGRGAISEALMHVSKREAKYSHAGIFSIEENRVFVYHAIGGEENKTNKLRKDPIEVFCNPRIAYSFGIYQLNLNPSQLVRVDSLVKYYYSKGLEFDTQFDLKSDNKMYCTEFVYKIIEKVTGDNRYFSVSKRSGITFVGCDDLYLNPHSSPLYSYHY